MTYPYVTPTTTVVLRNPEFGNRERLGFNRINRETRGGSLIVFADPQWPKIKTVQVTLNSLSADQAADLKAFLRESLGKEIGLLDYENRQWRGIITNPDTEVANPGRCDYTAILEFEGDLLTELV